MSSLVRTRATIRGTGILPATAGTSDGGSAGWKVRLGDVDAEEVIAAAGQLELTIPSGLAPGSHDVTVVSPNLASGTLADALTVVDDPIGLAVSIEDAPLGAGARLQPTSLAAGATLELHAVLRDPAQGAYVAPVEVTWTIVGDAIGELAPGPSTSVTFTALHVGAGAIHAAHEVAGDDDTGSIDVVAGQLAQLAIQDRPTADGLPIGPLTLTTDESLALFAIGRDAWGNVVPAVEAAWSVSGGIGQVTSRGPGHAELSLLHPGAGSVTAQATGISATTGLLSIVPGRAASFQIVPDTLVMTRGGPAVSFALTDIVDSDGNPTTDVGTIAWSVGGGPIGEIDAATGIFTPLLAGAGAVRAASSHGPVDWTGAVTVRSGAALTASISAPAEVSPRESFTVGMSVRNIGDAEAASVVPCPLGLEVGSAALVAGPSPPAATLPPSATAVFTWTYQAPPASGVLRFSGCAGGIDATTGNPVSSPTSASDSVSVHGAASLRIVLLALPAGPLEVDETFDVTLLVANTGEGDATDVVPSAVSVSGSGGATPSGASTPTTVPAGTTAVITFVLVANATGDIQVSSSVEGVDARTGAYVAAPAATSGSTTIRPPAVRLVAHDPFGDGTTWANLAPMSDAIVVGPRDSGHGAISMDAAGSSSDVAFSFPRDLVGHRNGNSAAPPYTSIGSADCARNTLECGPDNEDARGLLGSAILSGAEWLVLGPAKARWAGIEYVYLSPAPGPTADFRYVDLSAFPVTGARALTAMRAFRDRLYLGFSHSGGNPVLLAVVRPPPEPGLDATDEDLLDLAADEIGEGILVAPTGGAIVDVLVDFHDRLYLANAFGWVRSSNNQPTSKDHFVVITPSAPAHARKVSLSPESLWNLTPAARAVPAMVAWNDRLFAARNTTVGPQLWSCDPAMSRDLPHCDAGDWQLVAANDSGDPDLTQFGNPHNTAISLLAATPSYLYVGFDNHEQGVVIFRTASADPVASADFAGRARCPASLHSTTCQGLGGNGLGAPTTHSRILDAKIAAPGGHVALYLLVGDGANPLGLYQLGP